jgi:hypothetical protein
VIETIRTRWTYTLDTDQLEEVDAHTRKIIEYNTRRNLVNNWPIGDESDYEIKFRGFCAEYAMALLNGVVWRKIMFGSGYRELKPIDIGRRTDVRNVPDEHGRLTMKRRDSVDNVYLLAVGRPPTFRAAGWLEGRELLRFPYLEPPEVRYPAHFASIPELHPMPLPEDA